MGIYTYIFTPELQAQDYMSGFVEPRSNECCHSQPASRRPFSPPFAHIHRLCLCICAEARVSSVPNQPLLQFSSSLPLVVLSQYLFCFRASVLLAATGIRCLTHNERHNQTIQCQGLGENEHNEHTDKQFVLVAHDDGGIGHTAGGTSVLVSAAVALAAWDRSEHSGHVALGPEAGGDDAGLADHADGPAGGQAGQPAREPGCDVSPAVELGVGVGANVVVGFGDPPGDDDGHDEAVDAEDAGHDDGDEVLDHSPRVVHSHLA
mmetsp:Transcript_27957/g.65632  ORF Transcript_27957/g.65632 Transcript_27957/m.65632 type:complete len:263 (+) Transcript_27957:56-844(+)